MIYQLVFSVHKKYRYWTIRMHVLFVCRFEASRHWFFSLCICVYMETICIIQQKSSRNWKRRKSTTTTTIWSSNQDSNRLVRPHTHWTIFIRRQTYWRIARHWVVLKSLNIQFQLYFVTSLHFSGLFCARQEAHIHMTDTQKLRKKFEWTKINTRTAHTPNKPRKHLRPGHCYHRVSRACSSFNSFHLLFPCKSCCIAVCAKMNCGKEELK